MTLNFSLMLKGYIKWAEKQKSILFKEKKNKYEYYLMATQIKKSAKYL